METYCSAILNYQGESCVLLMKVLTTINKLFLLLQSLSNLTMAERKIWSEKEDNLLRMLVEEKGMKRWSEISKVLALEYDILRRNGKQCRERYLNHLATGLKKGEWTPEEEKKLVQVHNRLGNRWADISHLIPGRTDNCVKNQLYSKLRKSLRFVNDSIDQHFKKKFKHLKIDFIYKLIEMAEEKYKQHPIIKKEAFEESFDIKNQILNLEMSDDSENLIRICSLISAINKFNKKYKKRLPKRKHQQKHRQDEEEQQQLSIEQEQALEPKPKSLPKAKNSISSFSEVEHQSSRKSFSRANSQSQFADPFISISYVPSKRKSVVDLERPDSQDGFSQNSLKVKKSRSGDSVSHSAVNRLHSLSIEKEPGFKAIVQKIEDEGKSFDLKRDFESNFFTRVDPAVHGENEQNKVRRNLKRQGSRDSIPDIMQNTKIEAPKDSILGVSRLRSFGSIEASFEIRNSNTPKPSSFERKYLCKEEVENWLQNIQ